MAENQKLDQELLEKILRNYIAAIAEDYIIAEEGDYEKGFRAGKVFTFMTIFESLGVDPEDSPEFIDEVENLYKSLDKLLALALKEVGGD